MRRLVPLVLLSLLCASCSQDSRGGFGQYDQVAPPSPIPRAQLDLPALAQVRAKAAAALARHLDSGGRLDLAWGSGLANQVAGPYADAPPEAAAAALQALRTPDLPLSAAEVDAGQARVAGALAEAFMQLDGPRGGAYLLLADAAHPPRPAKPAAVDSPETTCATPGPAPARPECLRRQVSDNLLTTWYTKDRKMFFKVGETSTVYRPVDAIAVGSALVVAGYQQHDETKIRAGEQIIQREMSRDLDQHYGLLYGLVTATAQGGHQVTDYRTRVADQAGAAEALLEAFDASREHQFMAHARTLLQPLLDEKVALRAPSGGYITGFDLQSSGPPAQGPSDVLATILVLQAARHYDRDDGNHFARLEETAAAALIAALDGDRKQGGDPSDGLPATVPEGRPAMRSGLATALAVVVLGDVARDLAPSPSPSPSR
jgi:hypothetical protein